MIHEQIDMMITTNATQSLVFRCLFHILLFLFSEFNAGHIRHVSQELLHQEDFECALCMR